MVEIMKWIPKLTIDRSSICVYVDECMCNRLHMSNIVCIVYEFSSGSTAAFGVTLHKTI